mgnify:CR=1 FL=1
MCHDEQSMKNLLSWPPNHPSASLASNRHIQRIGSKSKSRVIIRANLSSHSSSMIVNGGGSFRLLSNGGGVGFRICI